MSLPPPTIEAVSFRAELAGRGVTLYATDEGNLRFHPKSLLSQEDIWRLKEHKPELLQLLGFAGEISTATTATTATPTVKPDTYAVYGSGSCGSLADIPPDRLPLQVRRELESASELGLVARWASEYGFIAIHDPSTGTWHDLPMKDAPGWAKREAFRRRELYKEKGIRRVLTAREMQGLWDEEHPTVEERPESNPQPVSEGGLVYEDYLEEED